MNSSGQSNEVANGPFLRRIIDNLIALVGVLDLEGNLVEANKPALAIADLAPEDVLGKPFWDCYWWAHSAATQDRLKAAFCDARAGDVVRYDVAVRVSGGELMWIDFQLAPLFNDDGQVTHLIASGSDLSERKKAERALKSRESQLEFAAAAGRIGIWEVDLITDMYSANDVDFELYGLTYSDKPLRLEDSIRQTYVDAEYDRIHAEIQKSIDTGQRLVQEKRVKLPDGSIRWLEVVSEPKYDDAGQPVARLGVTIDITARKKNEEHVDLLMREVNHRSKNLLAVVQSIANSTARHASPEHFAKDLARRLQSLSECQDLLIDGNWQAVDLRKLVLSQLGYLGDDARERFVLTGEGLSVLPATAQAIAMALHELTTNALKYGALSNEAGRVEICWHSIVEETGEVFHMTWRERGGPPVAPPEDLGFGHTVMERMVAHSVGGAVDLDYERDGVVWSLRAPLENIAILNA